MSRISHWTNICRSNEESKKLLRMMGEESSNTKIHAVKPSSASPQESSKETTKKTSVGTVDYHTPGVTVQHGEKMSQLP